MKVLTNDPLQPEIRLTISGYVEGFADVSPKFARLTGTVGEHTAVAVTILPREKYPFKIIGSTVRNGANIRYDIREGTADGAGGYTLMVENRKQEPGRYHDLIILKTDNPLKPGIPVRIFGNILKRPEPVSES